MDPFTITSSVVSSSPIISKHEDGVASTARLVKGSFDGNRSPHIFRVPSRLLKTIKRAVYRHSTLTVRQLRITGNCVGAAHTLWEISNAWKRAPVTVGTLCSQLKLTASSLSQIQSLLLDDTDVLRQKPDLVNTFDTTLTSCLVLTSWLEKYMHKIKKGVHEGGKATWKMKFKTVWNESDVKELLGQLQTQQTGISVLVNLLQM
jgi:hypothetical protein